VNLRLSRFTQRLFPEQGNLRLIDNQELVSRHHGTVRHPLSRLPLNHVCVPAPSDDGDE